ncbi:MAG: hypothetical protein AAGC60_26615 [Acidobacteriota bacterium]
MPPDDHGPTGILHLPTGFPPLMHRAAHLLVLLALCVGLLGPGWAQEPPTVERASIEGHEGTPIELRAPIDHRAESPVRAVTVEAPERSLLDTRAFVAASTSSPAPRRSGLPTLGARPPLDRAPAPARHLELCVFLC